jgi:L-alanine-DL-glutamate epimerase-like enolase superfamily enzyme
MIAATRRRMIQSMGNNSAIIGGAVAHVGKATDVRAIGAELYLLPVTTRMPLKFGPETLTTVTCARVKLTVRDRNGREAEGWGETPLSVQWTWPGQLSFAERHDAMVDFSKRLAAAWTNAGLWGHSLEIGYRFQREVLPALVADFNRDLPTNAHMPYLAALVSSSAFDIALHDAYGRLHALPTYDTYEAQFLSCDLADFYSADDPDVGRFRGKFPADFLTKCPAQTLPVWHLVGGLDPLDENDLDGSEPRDGHPVTLGDWINSDGLNCLKVKLRGNDCAWDYNRIERVGQIAMSKEVEWLSADFNCTVTEPSYVNEVLDRLKRDQPKLFGMLLYAEQPFPYDLEKFPIDVRSVSSRKPLFLDESAHDWQHVRRGVELGWTGVALKTCKTQTGAILSLCWARAHGMPLMVQDLSNPMLAQIPHVLLAAHADTIMGVESNAMQFYPGASSYEARVHPGLYKRRDGRLDLSSIRGPGFGYRLDEIARPLPPAVIRCGER